MRHRLQSSGATFVALVVILALGVSAAFGAASEGMWYRQESGVRYTIDSIFFVDENTGWAVGDRGTVLKTTDGGETWTPQNPGTGAWVTDVHFVDENTGWVVGDSGFVARTTNGGATWVPQHSTTTKNLWNVQFINADVGWAVGPAGGDGPPPPGVYSTILKTTNGGLTWTEVEGHELHVLNLHFIDENTGWLAGDGLYKSTDGGDTWQEVRPKNSLYRAVHFVGADTGWVVGAAGRILHTTDGGANWVTQDSGVAVELVNVYFLDADNGWVVGNDGLILATADGGATWRHQFSGGTRYLGGIFFIDQDTGWASGPGGTILAYRYPAPSVLPVEGDNRYLTAIEASKRAYPTGADTVVIATGRNWPDALGGTSLAGALDGPILLVGTNVIPEAVAEEIERLGAGEAILLGGTAAVSALVEAELGDLLGEENVERIEGANRYRTADAVAMRVIEELGDDYDGTAFVATGGNFPDALAAAPLAAAKSWPLFLAHPTNGITSATEAAMSEVTDVLLLGGDAAVSAAVEQALLGKYGSDQVTRLWGANRYATAVAVAEYGVDEVGLQWDLVGVTTGENFPDALAGGVMQGRAGSVMLLTRSSALMTPTRDALIENKDAISTVTYFGGANAVTQGVRDAIEAALN